MNKCDFCPDARLKNGQLTCPFSVCMMSERKIKELLERLAKIKMR